MNDEIWAPVERKGNTIRAFEPKDEERYLDFLVDIYPHRDPRYLRWWLNDVCRHTDDGKNRTFLVERDGEIIGATSGYWQKIYIDGKPVDFYWAGNTIIRPEFRGCGAGRLIYDKMAMFYDRMSTGFTDIAHKIQFRIIPNIKAISTVHVHISLTPYVLQSILLGKKRAGTDIKVPEKVKGGKSTFQLVKSPEKIKMPENGLWTGDRCELPRDQEYIQKRFFETYLTYHIYSLEGDGDKSAYFVVRRATYKGIDMLSLVDYRATDKALVKDIIKAVNKIARKNKIGFVIILTSDSMSGLWPPTIKTPKKLYGGASLPQITADDEILITSAESDLDFVYYQ